MRQFPDMSHFVAFENNSIICCDPYGLSNVCFACGDVKYPIEGQRHDDEICLASERIILRTTFYYHAGSETTSAGWYTESDYDQMIDQISQNWFDADAPLGFAPEAEKSTDFYLKLVNALGRQWRSQFLGYDAECKSLSRFWAGAEASGVENNSLGVVANVWFVGSLLRASVAKLLISRVGRFGTLGAGGQYVDDLAVAARGSGLPGSAGVQLSGRPTVAELQSLSRLHQVEFAVV